MEDKVEVEINGREYCRVAGVWYEIIEEEEYSDLSSFFGPFDEFVKKISGKAEQEYEIYDEIFVNSVSYDEEDDEVFLCFLEYCQKVHCIEEIEEKYRVEEKKQKQTDIDLLRRRLVELTEEGDE